MSNVSDTEALSKFFAFDGQGDPVLPEVPYNYADIEFPDHLLATNMGFNENEIFDGITDEAATLGRVLFYDEILSANQNLACATCHLQNKSFADVEPFSQGVSDPTKRNSMHLNDLGWSNRIGFFWDLSQHDLKQMIALPLTNQNEIGLNDMDALIAKMEATTYYTPLFEAAFGSTEITQNKVQEALTQFIRSMITFESKYDKVSRGELNYQQKEARGLTLFQRDCENCHMDGNATINQGLNYPTNIYANTFLYENGIDLDNGDEGAGVWANQLNGHFKSPTLRNISFTAPYMHDGRFDNLEDVVDHYSDDFHASSSVYEGVRGFDYTEGQKEDLIAFLKTLDDVSFTTNVKWSDPFPRTPTGVTNVNVIQEVSVYPNPSNGLTYVSFDNVSAQKVSAYLMTMDGKVLRKMSSHNNGLMTDVSQLPKGMYIVRVGNEEQYVDKKLIVQ